MKILLTCLVGHLKPAGHSIHFVADPREYCPLLQATTLLLGKTRVNEKYVEIAEETAFRKQTINGHSSVSQMLTFEGLNHFLPTTTLGLLMPPV